MVRENAGFMNTNPHLPQYKGVGIEITKRILFILYSLLQIIDVALAMYDYLKWSTVAVENAPKCKKALASHQGRRKYGVAVRIPPV